MYLAQFLPNLYKGLDADGKPGFSSINEIAIVLANLIQVGLFLAGILAVIFITYSGIQYITSQGDPGKVESAKNGLRNAIVGLILASGAYLLVSFFAAGLSK